VVTALRTGQSVLRTRQSVLRTGQSVLRTVAAAWPMLRSLA
jgi:hypothetical protein